MSTENLMAIKYAKKNKWRNRLKTAECLNDFADVITSNSYVVRLCQEKKLKNWKTKTFTIKFEHKLQISI